jgi:hypothetical protein
MVMGMKEIKKSFIRMVIYILIFVGICAIWEVADVSMYGESQHSIMDLIAALFMANCLDEKIWGDGNGT